MTEIVVRTENDQVVVGLRDPSGEALAVGLDRYQLVTLMVDLTERLNELPSDPSAPIHGVQPVLRSYAPSFQVGLTDDGECLLAIRPDPLPPMHFLFDAEGLAKLIADLRSAAISPPTSKSSQ